MTSVVEVSGQLHAPGTETPGKKAARTYYVVKTGEVRNRSKCKNGGKNTALTGYRVPGRSVGICPHHQPTSDYHKLLLLLLLLDLQPFVAP